MQGLAMYMYIENYIPWFYCTNLHLQLISIAFDFLVWFMFNVLAPLALES